MLSLKIFYCVLTALVLSRCFCNAMINVKAVFPSKSEKHGSSRMVLVHSIGHTKELTLCHWISATENLKANGSFTVSYASGQSPDEFLLGFVPTQGSDVYIQVSIRDQPARILTALFRTGQWQHVCVTWSSGNGRVTAYVDGQRVGANDSVQQGQEIRAGGVLMVGQDQDIYNGKFDDNEAWEGSLSDLQIWDEVLAQDAIVGMAQCKIHMNGNLVSWMKSPFRILNGVVLSESNLCRNMGHTVCK